MLAEAARRIAVAALTIAALLTIVFVIVHLAPGDPVSMVEDPDLDDARRDLLRERMGLDRPLAVQYRDWVLGAVRGDFGRSLVNHRPVSEMLAATLPRTLLLTFTAYLVHLLLAGVMGVAMAVRRGGWLDRGLNAAGLLVYSMPAFWLALMLILIFSRTLGWLPASGMHDPVAELAGAAGLADLARHMVLPVCVLGAASAVGTARYLRSALIEVLDADFVTAARARGLTERAVILNHALRNALLPMVTLVGLNLPFLLGGAVITETVFAWPGMGRLTVDAIFARDYPVIMAATVVAGVMVVLGNLLADLLYGLVDPRIRWRREDGR